MAIPACKITPGRDLYVSLWLIQIRRFRCSIHLALCAIIRPFFLGGRDLLGQRNVVREKRRPVSSSSKDDTALEKARSRLHADRLGRALDSTPRSSECQPPSIRPSIR